jgi:hypothetical protein
VRSRLWLAWTFGLVNVAGAQDSTSVCQGRRITAIDVQSPERTSVDAVRPAAVRPLVRAVLQAAPTRPAVLRPWILLKEGGACTEARRRETEHLLRELPFVASATVQAVPDGDGVRLVVEAVDELKPVLGLRLDDAVPQSLRFGSANLAGSGTFVAGEWADGDAYRDGFAVQATSWGALRSRAIVSLLTERRPLGEVSHLEIGAPFLTRFQSLAWTFSARTEHDYVRLQRNVSEPFAWPTRWRLVNAGALTRLQVGSVQMLAGGLATHERITSAEEGVVIGSDGLEPPPAALARQYDDQNSVRGSAVVGVRALSFQPAPGLEALEGVHDVARGVQMAIASGRGFSGAHDGAHLATELYAGVGTATSFANLRATFEQRNEHSAPATRLLSGRAAWYWLAGRRQTQELSVEYVAVWREDIPFAVFLDDRRVGPRGFTGATASGSRLLVARAERRVRTGGFGQAVGLGMAVFADAAKLWAGNTPLGSSPAPRLGVGAGLLVAIPRSSRRTIRLDAAAPLTPGGGASGVSARLTVRNAGRAYWREPASFLRARIVPSLRSLVGWF